MALLTKPTQHAWYPSGPPMTEQEHRDSCDVNKMIKSALRGMQVRAKASGLWRDGAFDDTTMDAVRFRIEKDNLERELSKTAQTNEFEENELKHIPEVVQKKFGFRKKAPKPAKNDDDSTTTKKAPEPDPKTPSSDPS